MSIRTASTVAMLLLLTVAGFANAQSVTRSTFRALEEIQELTEEDRLVEALAKLEILVEKTRGNAYDSAVSNQYLAHTSVMLDKPERARTALEEALSSEDQLPPEIVSEIKLFYGSLILGDEEYELATELLEDWLATEETPVSRQLFTVSYANYMSGNLERAEELISLALEKGGETSPDNWYQVYYRILFELKKYKEGEELLYSMIERKPSVALHWRLLASHYLQLEQSSDALATIMLSYMNGQIEDQSDLKQIVSLYSYVDVPEKAARLLQDWIDEGKIEDDPDMRKQLGNLWLMAREREKAKSALQAAAEASPDGKTYVLLGSIHFDDEEWESAHTAYMKALDLGGLEDSPRVRLLAGMSAYWAGNMEEAKTSLRKAAESEEFRSQAEAMLKKISGG